MKYLVIAALFVSAGVGAGAHRSATAQPIEVSLLTSERPPARISLQPRWQRYDDGGHTLSEWSMPLVAVVPLRDDLLFGLRTGLAHAEGADLASVRGRDDVQATLSYAQRIGAGSLVANLSANLPSGTTAFTAEEFETMAQLSRNVYAFRVPGLGQGFNLAPGVTWAVPASETVTLGLGVAYQLRGRYRPLRAMDGRYDPGNEVRLTGGVDVQVGATSTLAGDVTFTHYGTDTIEGIEQYAPGHKLAFTAQYRRTMGFDAVRVVVRYQSQARSSVPVAPGRSDEAEALRILPDQGRAFVMYRVRVHEVVDISWRAEGRRFGETAIYDDETLFAISAAPAFAVGGAWTVTSRFAYLFGSLSGMEAGLGMAVEF